MGIREAKKARKIKRIEAAARRLFTANGYQGTSTRAIAAAAEIGVGTLFVYFPEKRDLLLHLFRGDVRRVMEEYDARPPPQTRG